MTNLITLTSLPTGDLLITRDADATGVVEFARTGEVSYTITSEDAFSIALGERDFYIIEGETAEMRLIARAWCSIARTYGTKTVAN